MLVKLLCPLFLLFMLVFVPIMLDGLGQNLPFPVLHGDLWGFEHVQKIYFTSLPSSDSDDEVLSTYEVDPAEPSPSLQP